MKAEVSKMKEKSRIAGGRYIQNEQLEELRNLQEKLTKERQEWTRVKEKETSQAEDERERIKQETVNSVQ